MAYSLCPPCGRVLFLTRVWVGVGALLWVWAVTPRLLHEETEQKGFLPTETVVQIIHNNRETCQWPHQKWTVDDAMNDDGCDPFFYWSKISPAKVWGKCVTSQSAILFYFEGDLIYPFLEICWDVSRGRPILELELGPLATPQVSLWNISAIEKVLAKKRAWHFVNQRSQSHCVHIHIQGRGSVRTFFY
jgi:hypothetical protein